MRGKELPPIEQVRRAPRIEPAKPWPVLGEIHEHIGQRVAHLTRRTKSMGMVAIVEKRPCSPHDAVAAARDANRETGDPPRKLLAALRLDQEVRVVVLNAEVNHPKPGHLRTPKLPSNFAKQALTPKTREPLANAHRDVDWMMAAMIRATLVPDATRSVRLSPSTNPSATPSGKRKRKLPGTHHLEFSSIIAQISFNNYLQSHNATPACSSGTQRHPTYSSCARLSRTLNTHASRRGLRPGARAVPVQSESAFHFLRLGRRRHRCSGLPEGAL
jgi:hypothetical protein